MAFILDENGKFVDTSKKSIDELKRENYKHKNGIKEGLEEVMDLEVEDKEEEIYQFDDTDLEEMDAEEISDEEISDEEIDLMEVAVLYGEFVTILKDKFEDIEEIDDMLEGIEAYLESKGVELDIDEEGFSAEKESIEIVDDAEEKDEDEDEESEDENNDNPFDELEERDIQED